MYVQVSVVTVKPVDIYLGGKERGCKYDAWQRNGCGKHNTAPISNNLGTGQEEEDDVRRRLHSKYKLLVLPINKV